MGKLLKRTLTGIVSAAMITSSLAVPMAANAYTGNYSNTAGSWKFDFGSSENVADGYIGVSADSAYSKDAGYGFLGIGADGYRAELLTGETNTASGRVDSFGMVKGQEIVLANGGSETPATAEDDNVGVTKAQMPIRFSMDVENGGYYHVKVTLTGADSSKDATVSLFSEKRHLMLMDKTIPAGESITYEYNADVESLYYQKSSPEGNYVDSTLNVVVAGENAAIASLEVTKAETNGRTLWVLGDSTVCDQGAYTPYFPLQNYAGVGQALTKYTPENIAVSNQGEGGLNAGDALHFNNVVSNVKEGDYIFVEYGHNHKDDGPTGYLACLPKYYELAKQKNAKLIVVGPIDRHNDGQYNASTNTWSSTLGGFSTVGKQYVEDKIAEGATNIAFIDLNEQWLRWMEGVCEDVKTKRGADVYERNATDYYFTYNKYGVADGTHINDAGADNAAYIFYDQVKKAVAAGNAEGATDSQKVQAAVLTELATGVREGTPYVVSEEVVKAGTAPNTMYPDAVYAQGESTYPAAVSEITIGEGGNIAQADVNVTGTMSGYGLLIITVYSADGTKKGEIRATEQVDNTTGTGIQKLTKFDNAVTIGETDTIKAVVVKAADVDGVLTPVIDEETSEMIPFSTVWEPTDIKEMLLTREDTEGLSEPEKYENFEYFGAADGDTIKGKGKWSNVGSATIATTLKKADDESWYAHFESDGVKPAGGTGSFYAWTEMTEVSSGKVMMKMKICYNGGTASLMLTDAFSNPVSGFNSATSLMIAEGGAVTLGGKSVGKLNQGVWATLTYTIDMDYGIETAQLEGEEKVEIENANFGGTSATLKPASLSRVLFTTGATKAVNFDVADLTVASLKTADLPEKTVTVAVAADSADKGTVYIGEEGTATQTATMNTTVTVTAKANTGFIFDHWEDAEGNICSYASEYQFRLHDNIDLKAVFAVEEVDPYNCIYKEDFKTMTTADDLKAAGWTLKGGEMSIQTDASNSDILTYFKHVPASTSGCRGVKFTMPTDAQVSTGVYALDFNLAMTPAADRPTQFAVFGKGVTVDTNDTLALTSTVFQLDLGKGNANPYLNGTSDSANGYTSDFQTTGVTSGAWMHVVATMDFDNKAINVKITSLDDSTTYMNATTTIDASITGIGGLFISSGRGTGSVSLDNIKLYASEMPQEPKDPEIVVTEGKVTITNGSAADMSGSVVVAYYDKDNNMTSIAVTNDVAIKAGADYEVTVDTTKVTGENTAKVMYVELSKVKPLVNVFTANEATFASNKL